MEDRIIISNRITKVMYQNKIKQRDIIKVLQDNGLLTNNKGSSKAIVSRWCNGKQDIPNEVIYVLSIILNVEFKYLLLEDVYINKYKNTTRSCYGK